MKRCVLVIALLGYSLLSVSQQSFKGDALQQGYYIVVAAYRINQEKFMIDYSEKLNQRGLHAKYGYDLSRNYYYVYIDFYSDFNESIEKMLSTRKESGFEKAWVRVIRDNPLPTEKIQPIEEASIKNLPEEKQTEKKKEQILVQPLVGEEKLVVTEKVETHKEVQEKIEEDAPRAEAKFLFRLYGAYNNEPIDGVVEIVDAERSVLLKKEKGNQVVSIPNPKSKSGDLTFIGSSFGYRKVQRDLSLKTLKDSLPNFMEWNRDARYYVIKFDLTQLQRGDIETLYDVYFFNDAAVMLPESKYELNKLLAMMANNLSYRIKLHGHTNGNGKGRIIYMGQKKNFFELSSDVVTGSGSAKELSLQRANTIKDWLIANGITADRIETKGWGGARMIHDKDSDKARRNVRVEVEVLAD